MAVRARSVQDMECVVGTAELLIHERMYFLRLLAI